jgi:Flp pilus assembly protein TadG
MITGDVRRRRRPMHGHRRLDETGTASIWALVAAAGAFTLLLGLVVDGGALIETRVEATQVAEQAARLAADQLSERSVRNGGDAVDPGPAAAAARDYLRASDLHGSVKVRGDAVTVTVTSESPNRVLNVIGVSAFPVVESATAMGITEEDVP